MKALYGFFMAWGMFCGIPCPVKKWDEKYRGEMLVMLPVLGLLLGFFWWTAGELLCIAGIHMMLNAAVLTALPFILTGSIHTDGYMDVCDAVFSRKEQEERRKILKDPHTGSFAMIGLVIYSLLFFGAACAALDSVSSEADSFAGVIAWMIPVPAASRFAAVWSLMSFPKLPESQYSEEKNEDVDPVERPAGRTARSRMAAYSLICIVFTVTVISVGLAGSVPASVYASTTAGCVPAAAALIAAFIAGAAARRDIGGMNGDICGAMITVGDLAGMIACALIA